MRKTFLETDNSHIKPGFVFVGVNFCSAPNLSGVEQAADKIRELSFRYANADGTSAPLKVYSPEEGYILKDVTLKDSGNVSAASLNALKRAIDALELPKEAIPVFVGGDHSVTYPNISKVCKESSDIVVLQFDAHSDYIDEYEDYPHGSVMKEVSKLERVAKIIHFGIRGNLNCGPALEDSKACGNIILPYAEIEQEIGKVLEYLEGKEIYITFDTDFINPAFASATNCPEPGGPSYEDAKKYLNLVIKSCKRVVGMDFVEYNPTYEGAAITGLTIVNLIMEAMSYISTK